MTSLPSIARMYVGGVIAAGCAVGVASIANVSFPNPILFAVLLGLSMVSAALKVDLPIGVGSSSISLSYAVDFTALLLLGPAPTMLIALATGWAQCTFRMKERNPLYKTVFSMASLVLAVGAAGFTYRSLGGTHGELAAAPLQPLLAAAMAYFLVNSSTVAAAFALSTGRSALRVWHDNFLWSITSYVIGGIAAGVAVEVLLHARQWQTVLAIVPLGLTYPTYRIFLARIAAEQKRASDWAVLQRESTEVLARAIQAKDGNGSTHIDRVQYYATSLARRLGLSERDTQAVEIAAILHDVGKLAVPEHILSKPGPLTIHERRKVEIHAQIGADIVDAVQFPCPAAPIVRSHHERWDGAGYPAGLQGESIPIGARILAVADCFDALTSDRPHRHAFSREEALRILHQGSGRAFDPKVVAAFTALYPHLDPPADDDEPSGQLHLFRDTAEGFATHVRARRRGAEAFAEIASANRESYTLYEIAHAMGRSMSVAETMTLISSKVSRLVPFSSCAVFVRDVSRNLRCRFATGVHADLLEGASVRNGEGLSGWVARHNRALVNGVPAAEFEAAGLEVPDAQLAAALVCPLAVDGQVIGTIAVFHAVEDCYSEDHRRVLEQISDQAAAVVLNAVTFEQAQDEAQTDGLTGLANVRALQSHVAREQERARRTGSEFALVLLDVDEFKGINDRYGHMEGDRALQEVGRILRQTTRPYDICVRYGGDEFVVLLPSCGRIEAEARRRELQDTVARLTFDARNDDAIHVDVSAGVAVFPEDGETYERLLARADRRMYRDKARRKASLHRAVVDITPHLQGFGYSAG